MRNRFLKVKTASSKSGNTLTIILENHAIFPHYTRISLVQRSYHDLEEPEHILPPSWYEQFYSHICFVFYVFFLIRFITQMVIYFIFEHEFKHGTKDVLQSIWHTLYGLGLALFNNFLARSSELGFFRFVIKISPLIYYLYSTR